jgi:hypothetical protein
MSDPCRRSARLHLFVDPPVQIALIVRVVCYWLICLAAVTLLRLCWHMLADSAQTSEMLLDSLWFDIARACEISLILLPLVLFDILRLSNRFVGPLLRLRQSMRQLARGEHVDPIEFRGSDFWREFAGEFNALLSRVEKSDTAAGQGREDDLGRQWQLASGGRR